MDRRIEGQTAEPIALSSRAYRSWMMLLLVALYTLNLLDRHAIVKDTNVNVDDALSWRQNRLVFKDVRLGDVVGEFNRYNQVKGMVWELGYLGNRSTYRIKTETGNAVLVSNSIALASLFSRIHCAGGIL